MAEAARVMDIYRLQLNNVILNNLAEVVKRLTKEERRGSALATHPPSSMSRDLTGGNMPSKKMQSDRQVYIKEERRGGKEEEGEE